MPTVTINVSQELKKRMDAHNTVNWSAVARNSFEKQISDLEFFEKIAQKANLTEEDAIIMGRELKRNARSYYGWNSSSTQTSSSQPSSKKEKHAN